MVDVQGTTHDPDARQPSGRRPTLATVSRGDPLTPYLHAALAARYSITADVDVELTGLSRAAVGALTVRPTRDAWDEKYMKSNVGARLRTRAARRGLAPVLDRTDVVVQTHALFQAVTDRTVLYIDCTYRQAERGWPAWTPLRGASRARWLRHETTLYRQAAHLFAFTDAARSSLVDDYGVPEGRVTTVGAGVNFYAEPHSPTPSAAGPPTVLFVGKDFARKGGDVLLHAFARVRAVRPDVRLQIVGCEPDGPLPDGVEVLGRVTDRQRMVELYAGATVFCLPSRFDPAPLVVLEAMSTGLPCVLSRGAAAHVHGVLGDGGGWLAEDGDSDRLAEGILTYVQSPDAARRAGAVAQRATAERFRWSDVVERMAPAIAAIAARRGH
ncbi:glycosyltransferase family 4 protein [uncultured Jatrophihabitans sp.]|uniref:glycosyltransferase family 4 protein n=1 Tax=uncultured Jatrophihabitans sp. TaxID=1610747 RepID=UPI0035CBED89